MPFFCDVVNAYKIGVSIALLIGHCSGFNVYPYLFLILSDDLRLVVFFFTPLPFFQPLVIRWQFSIRYDHLYNYFPYQFFFSISNYITVAWVAIQYLAAEVKAGNAFFK